MRKIYVITSLQSIEKLIIVHFLDPKIQGSSIYNINKQVSFLWNKSKLSVNYAKKLGENFLYPSLWGKIYFELEDAGSF